MKQKVSVRAIIQDNEKTLMLKRASGRASILGRYELPGGKLGYGEQPEDSLRRYLRSDAGLEVQSMRLKDVVTYIDHDDRDTQYTFLLYVAEVAARTPIVLGGNYDHYQWWSADDLRREDLTDSSKLLLGIAAQQVPIEDSAQVSTDMAGEAVSDNHVIIYSDGGSRGNPGPSASGFVIMDTRENVIHQGGLYLGITTNNQAEYHGVRLGLEKALELGAKTVDFRMDSLLVVNQLTDVYKIKNRELWPINERIKELVTHFDTVSFSHVRREYNQLADGMVNKILNAHAEQSKV
jgi:ribonuclease HI/ADP-ribose pyrophosphatase YjhB (NUDIX family)